jgi:hydroxymethylbilane synthase
VRIVLATRRSPLALAQTEAVAGALRAAGHEPELLGLTTTGDRWSAAGTGAAPDKGLFVKELEEALGDGRADLAVHSAKDLPAELPDGLAVVAVPPREDARDVLVGPPGGLAALPAGARVATGSPRRAAQVLAARPDLLIVPIRGNVGTRLDKLARGDADALVLAAAGLARLGLAPGGAEPLPIEVSTPAPGQGPPARASIASRP